MTAKTVDRLLLLCLCCSVFFLVIAVSRSQVNCDSKCRHKNVFENTTSGAAWELMVADCLNCTNSGLCETKGNPLPGTCKIDKNVTQKVRFLDEWEEICTPTMTETIVESKVLKVTKPWGDATGYTCQ